LTKIFQMRIALLGYGKMGKEIEQIAIDRGHEISLKIDANNLNDFSAKSLIDTDVAIEFSTPETAYNNIQICFSAKVPVVAGTTGWLDKLDSCVQQCNKEGSGLFYASNYSVGVNVFFEINKKLAKLMAPYPSYKVEMEEIHHTQKLDAPSGTAITLAEGIIENNEAISKWVNDTEPKIQEINIVSKRIDKIPGTHDVTYENEIDEIYIRHTAHNRKGFALGAVLASEFMDSKSGFYGMKELMGL
jgi:4-hydroxy-tetrahydrodipicolinate reductase